MMYKVDRLLHELPIPNNPSPNAAAAIQELIGGKFGEMSTLMNYTFQSFNFRGRNRLRVFYDVIASIAGEEYGHIELVAYAINLLLTGTTTHGHHTVPEPTKDVVDARNVRHFIASCQQSLPNMERCALRGWQAVGSGVWRTGGLPDS